MNKTSTFIYAKFVHCEIENVNYIMYDL